MTVFAGNKGDSVRSDCYVNLELTKDSGIVVKLLSKVQVMYGVSIEKLVREIMQFFGIENANIYIEDKGALPFTIAARVEGAIKKIIKSDKEYLLPFLGQNKYKTAKDIDRFSRLYIPGNSPKLMLNSGIYESKGVILDLEDSVSPDKKDEARILVRNALRSVDFYGTERMVRINQLPVGIVDLEYIIPQNVNLVLIPKCEGAKQILEVENKIEEILGHKNDQIHLMPIIESALGVIKSYEIATASENVVALAIGLEDYTADIGVQRTEIAKESFYARSSIVNAAKAAGVQPIDSVFSDVDNPQALQNNVKESKALGFEGMGCIHPRQVRIINIGYSPTEKEIEKACRVVKAFEEAEEKGLAVVALGTKMIDPPVAKRAIRTIEQAIRQGNISKDWRSKNEQ